jgi:hypothetical protein
MTVRHKISRDLAAIAFALLLAVPAHAAGGKPTVASGFADFPAPKIYRGEVHQPDFRGRDREYSQYRTRIRKGLKVGPTLGGKYTVIQFGCGTGGCNIYLAVDLTTGQVVPLLPEREKREYEEYPFLVLDYQTNSRLIEARWVKDGRCLLQKFVIEGAQLNRSEVKDIGPQDACPASQPSYPFSF